MLSRPEGVVQSRLLIIAFLGILIRALLAGQDTDHGPSAERGLPSSSRTGPQTASKPGNRTSSPRILHGAAYIIDGDTLVIRKTQIRLFGIDAPELDHPYGQKAKWALATICKGQMIRAEISAQDVHGRAVARCYLPDGRDLSAEMVRQGMAIDWPKFSGGIYRALEPSDARKKLWLADARQKGRTDIWEDFEARQKARGPGT
ncbi:MAG: thermonuclease family protein [Paracoccus sp. (in: a-proteobacteria)]